MIRLANVGDTQRVVEMVEKAHAISPLAPYVDFCAPMVRDQFHSHLGSAASLCLVHDVGGIAQGVLVATAANYPSAPIRIGVEVVSWVEPEYRGMAWFRMKRWFEKWSKEKGCRISSLSSKSDERFAAAIKRDGYQYAESHYVKVL